MAKHVKHEDSLDVQVRTKFLDEYGTPMEGVIEYDPVTGFGKRIKDPTLGLIENFYRKGGHAEIDGHTFTDENHDDNKIQAIKTLIDAKVARGTETYEDQLKHHIAVNRANEKEQANKRKLSPITTLAEVKQANENITYVATTQIAKGETVTIDFETGYVTGTRSDNIFKPERNTEDHPDKKSFA